MNIIYNEIKDRVKDEKSLSEISEEIKIRFFNVQFVETQFFYDSNYMILYDFVSLVDTKWTQIEFDFFNCTFKSINYQCL